LLIDVAGFDNRSGGLLRATGSGNQPVGGILRLAINAPLRNTGGTIEALNGGRVEAAFARIEGGLIRALPVGADTGADGATTVAGQIPLGGMTIVNPTPNAGRQSADPARPARDDPRRRPQAGPADG
jgi:hypothetical protein